MWKSLKKFKKQYEKERLKYLKNKKIKPQAARKTFYEVRLIDENGKRLGIMSFGNACEMARMRGLDLKIIAFAEKTEPPVWGLKK